MASPASTDMDVLILAPFGKDSGLIANVLNESGIQVRIIHSARDLVAAIPDNAGVAIVAEEALSTETIAGLGGRLEQQPPWCDCPILVLTGGGGTTAATEVAVRARAPLGNVTLLERPLRPATLISAVRSALAARRRQYEIRDHLRERQLAEETLRSAHDALESIVEERTAALRHLSAQLLRAQDDERRRIARELHDSLGQYLAACKINLDTLALKGKNREQCFSEVRQLVDRAISETRTLSHLLHPPLLDVTGFASAASWYVEGFAQRSGIKSTLNLPEKLSRLSTEAETALFRIMQEALTNVHRHAASRRVEITLTANEMIATLIVRDFGKGIPQGVLDKFTQSGTNAGVGLAGIRERVKELGGTLEIHSNKKGTSLTACIPIAEQKSSAVSPPISQMYSSLAS